MSQSHIPLYLTFDDVLIKPKYSEVLPRQTQVHTQLSKNIQLNIPLISAAMDTVTEHELAIAIALEGGIGIIHKNLCPDRQAEEVLKVKRFENGFITNPICAKPSDLISDIYAIREKYGYKEIPITENGKIHSKLIGLISSNDYFYPKHQNQTVADRMTPIQDLLLTYDGLSLSEANDILEESKHSKLMVLNNAKEQSLEAIVSRKDLEKNRLYPNSCKDEFKRLRVGAAIGPASNMEERAQKLVEAGVDVLVVDTAHGHSKGVLDVIKYIKKHYPKIDVIGGNIASKEAVQALAEAGADAVKVGIGPGSICTTRVITGIGVPQLSALIECVQEAKKYNIPVIADGGIKLSGDIAKALAAGASSVMIGSLFAGCAESPGQLISYNGKTFKSYRGMGSIGAMKQGGKERYSQANIEEEAKYIAEGIEGQTLYKGPLHQELYQLVGGLRSAMGYTGSENLIRFQKNAEFLQITAAGYIEVPESIRRLGYRKPSPRYYN